MKLLIKTNIDIRSRLPFVETKLFCIFRWMMPPKNVQFLMLVKSYHTSKKVGKVLYIKWTLFDFLCVVCAGNEMKNSVLKELLVCECVFIYHLKRKSYYICIFSWIFQMLERLVLSHKQQCTMFYHGLSWCYVVLKWSLFLMSQLLNTLILYFRVEVFFLCWTTAVYSSIIFFHIFESHIKSVSKWLGLFFLWSGNVKLWIDQFWIPIFVDLAFELI